MNLPAYYLPSFAARSDAEQKLRRFARLPYGWSFGRGIPFEPRVIDAAVSLLQTGLSCGFVTTDVFPGLEGEVRVSFYYGEAGCDVTVEPSLAVSVEVTDAAGNEIADLSDQSVEQANTAVRVAAATITASVVRAWTNTPIYSILSTTTLTGAGLATWDLSQPPAITPFQQSTLTAPLNPLAAFVAISPLNLNTGGWYQTSNNPLIGASPSTNYANRAQPSAVMQYPRRAIA